MRRIDAKPMEDIKAFSRRLANLAHFHNERLVGVFNSHELIATPASLWSDVFDQWDLPIRRSYFGESAKYGTRSQ